MAKKKSSKKKVTRGTNASAEAPAVKKAGRRGGRKPGQWVHLEKDALSKYRKEAKLSRAKLAEILDVSSTSIQNWETGRSVPVKRFQLQLVELMSGKPVARGAGSNGDGRPPRGSGRVAAPSSGWTDGSPVQLQATRLTVVGEILKGYLATSQGAKVSPDRLVTLVGALRGALG